MEMIAQMKGKMADKVAVSCQPHDEQEFFASIKLDGHYCQVHINEDNSVDFYTSGNKRFYLSAIADQFRYVFKHLPRPIALECEYIYACKGKLGDRVNSARLTTYRTDFAAFRDRAGVRMDIFKVFNIINTELHFEDIVTLLEACVDHHSVHLVDHELVNFSTAKIMATEMANKGWEGLMLQSPYVAYRPGKRVNTTIKLKHRPEMIAEVVAEEEGEGRLIGMIGALACITSSGTSFSVGSGLSDHERSQWGAYTNNKIEVEYEQLSVEGVPLQPVFKRLKGNK